MRIQSAVVNSLKLIGFPERDYPQSQQSENTQRFWISYPFGNPRKNIGNAGIIFKLNI